MFFRKKINRAKKNFKSNLLIGFILLFILLYKTVPQVQRPVDKFVATVESFINDPQKTAQEWQAKQDTDIKLGKLKLPSELNRTQSGIAKDDEFNGYKTYYEYEGKPYMVINNNIPNFSMTELNSKKAFEEFTPLDGLGRVGPANALIIPKMMPTEKRQAIDSVKPSGWNNKKYDSKLVDGGWIYNRCHLIGHQLTGQNANEENLMTGTRSFNIKGMLPFENIIKAHLDKGGAVRYRITPVFNGDELVARGIYMEAQSLDNNEVSFFVYVFNNQDGIDIDYKTGKTKLSKK